MRAFWKAVYTVTVHLAGYAPWWVLLETTGHRTGTRRLTPLANGPLDGSTLALVSVYGHSAAFVKNIRANPTVRIQRRGRWLEGAVELLEPTPEAVDAFGVYAKRVLLRIGTKPKVLRFTVT